MNLSINNKIFGQISTNCNVCYFTDNEKPTLRCPHNIVTPTSSGLATVTLQQPNPLELHDNSGVDLNVESNWPSNGIFSIGIHFIAMTTVDPSQNQELCTFTITVEG